MIAREKGEREKELKTTQSQARDISYKFKKPIK